MSTDPAVTAATDAVRSAFLPNVAPTGVIDRIAPAAVAAVRPIIEAEVSARIAARIRAEVDTFAVGDYGRGHNAAMDLAARIVEGT